MIVHVVGMQKTRAHVVMYMQISVMIIIPYLKGIIKKLIKGMHIRAYACTMYMYAYAYICIMH